MAAEQRTNPFGAFNFKLDFEGPSGVEESLDSVGFMECTGLDSETAPMEYRDSLIPERSGKDGSSYTRKLPGMERYPNVVLRRGLTGSAALWKWRKLVRDGKPWEEVKANVIVKLQNEQHSEVMTWRLEDAWPCKLSGPTLNARTNEIAVETLELCCDRISLED